MNNKFFALLKMGNIFSIGQLVFDYHMKKSFQFLPTVLVITVF